MSHPFPRQEKFHEADSLSGRNIRLYERAKAIGSGNTAGMKHRLDGTRRRRSRNDRNFS